MDFNLPQLTPNKMPWRIDWLGEVVYYRMSNRHSQPCIKIAISPLRDPKLSIDLTSASSFDHQQQRNVWLPIGLLRAIQVGDVWQNGTLILKSDSTVETFRDVQIGATTTKFVKAGLPEDDQYLLPFEQHPWHQKHTDSYGVLVSLPEGKRLFVPCMELIRFYFGSTSALLGRLFTTPLSESILWRDKKFDEERGHLHLKLAEQISGASATDIGRMALDSHAWRTAANIFTSCLRAKSKNSPVYPYIGFPFEGESTLIANGMWLPFGEIPNATFVVFSLKSCSHPFPFNSLSYEIDKDFSLPTKDSSNESEGKRRRVISPQKNPKPAVLAESDPGGVKSSKSFWIQEKCRFPDLKSKSIWLDKMDVSEVSDIYLRAKDGGLSQIAFGAPSGSQAPRCADIVSTESMEDFEDLPGKLPRFVITGLQFLRMHVLKSSGFTFKVTGLNGGPAIISLPLIVDEDGEIEALTVTVRPNGRLRPRRACFIARYLFDTEVEKMVIVEGTDSFTPPIYLEYEGSDAYSVLKALEATS